MTTTHRWAAALLFCCSAATAAPIDSPEAAASAAQALLEPGQPAAAMARASVFDGFTRRQAEPLKPDARGDYHLRFDRTHRGVPVMGGDIIVHLRADGTLDGVTSTLTEPLALASVTPRWPREAAQARALDAFRDKGRDEGATTTLMVAAWTTIAPRPTLAWQVEVQGSYCGHPSRMQYWFDAGTGALLQRWEGLNSAVPWTCNR